MFQFPRVKKRLTFGMILELHWVDRRVTWDDLELDLGPNLR